MSDDVIEKPSKCLACGSEKVLPHCPGSIYCHWVQCTELSCKTITAVIRGELKAIAGRF